ncbi:MAG: ferrochelatase [Desulfobacterales bacterium]|nr:MAG: ferrochelatase [Desulfobacterales bacterium]
MGKDKLHGVILLNMGGPETQEEVHPFLYRLFSDRSLIELGPALLQKPIARYIARKRAPKSRKTYQQIGGGSPLKKLTREQASALETQLNAERSQRYLVTVAMRYCPPFSEEAVQQLLAKEIDCLTVLSLYPHYSRATGGSSILEMQRILKQLAPEMPVVYIKEWPDQPTYIQSLAGRILDGLEAFSGEPATVVYSAHSLPVSFVKRGDPYVEHLMRTITAVEQITRTEGKLCYQSRSGPVQWLSPSTSEMLQRLAEGGCKNVLMVPISFVSDHVETLYEIDILYRQQAEALGMHLRSSASLNADPQFIKALRELVLETKRD